MSRCGELNYRLAENSFSGGDPQSISNNFTSQQVAGEDTKSQQNTTTFSNDGNLVSASVNNFKRLTSMLTSTSADTSEQSMKAFLAKPVLMVSGTLGTTDTSGTFTRYTAPHDFLQKPVVLNKISGFLGFKGTLVVRFQINANKFQQGRYMLCFTHSGGSNPISVNGPLNYLAHTNTLVQRTQLPRIELDLSCDTQGVLKIPYTSCLNYTPISAITANNGFGAVGSLQIFPYSPLVAPSGSTTCTYSLWSSFEDVELISAAAPQAGKMMTGRSISEKEAASQQKGPLSSTLLKISKASSLFVPVPGISAYASGLSWISDIASNAASIFGWSKPVNQSSLVKTERQVLANFSHVNTVDQGQVLALNAKNAVDVLPGFSSTDTDEMDFSFLVTIPAWIKTFSWTTANTSGTALAEFGVYPSSLVQTRTGLGTIGITDYTPMQLVSSYFCYWRGSLVFTFKLVKTEYHSGRLAFVFFPHDSDNTVSARSLDLSTYTHREIVDVRESSIITVAIPYVANSSYRTLLTAGISIGTLSVYVLDPLIAPASVSSSITILTELAGGPDMEFAVPRSQQNMPVMSATPQSGRVLTEPMPDNQECAIVNSTIGDALITSDNSVNAAACIGEKITSFRTLLKCMNFMPYLVGEPTPSRFLTIVPYGSLVYSNTVANNYPDTIADLYSTLSGCYALVRGGVRLKIVGSSALAQNLAPVLFSQQVTFNTYSSFTNHTTVLPDGSSNPNASRISNPQQFNQVAANLCTETSIPQYHRYHSRATQDHYVGPSQIYTTQAASLANRTVVTYYYPGNTTMPINYVCRGGADDSNFGVFVSVPPMTNPNGVAGSL